MSATVALLHPGEMGAAIGAVLTKQGTRTLWASEGRGPATRERAAKAGLIDAGTLAAAVDQADIVLSVCPPHGAVDVARAVAAARFRGLYVDANAVAPATARAIGRLVEAAGATFVDGGIVGSPPSAAVTTRIYLAGKGAERAAAVLGAPEVRAVALDGPIGAASALKVCYAAWNKGLFALMADIRALAAHEGVEQALVAEWQESQPDALKRSEGVRTTARKFWRWVAEMEEIAGTFAAAGLPDGFHRASAEIFRRLERYKDAPTPTMDDITRTLNGDVSKPRR
jgi:3-hydroxyisobutyrate dehydrogenase-like beta-hydroxyacid dehydrogenase